MLQRQVPRCGRLQHRMGLWRLHRLPRLTQSAVYLKQLSLVSNGCCYKVAVATVRCHCSLRTDRRFCYWVACTRCCLLGQRALQQMVSPMGQLAKNSHSRMQRNTRATRCRHLPMRFRR